MTENELPEANLPDTNLPANTIIVGERDYAQAIDLVIAQATLHLQIFDQDFSHGDFASLKRFELIQAFLSKNAHNKLIIILQKAQFFKSHCPRLFDLLSVYGHKMTVYETNDNAKVAKDCFVIADKTHYVRRFHIDQARFKYALNDADESANLMLRFDELLAETAETVSATNLGL
jgi:hypothetical protein